MSEKLNYDEIKNIVNANNFELLTTISEFDSAPGVVVQDPNGYMYDVEIRNITRYIKKNLVCKNNRFSIYNIEKYIERHNIPFTCLATEYINNTTKMEFVCSRCGEHVWTTWRNINRNDNPNRNHIICPNCDGRTESTHALVLKQIFKHEHPDTVEEDPSCRNPATGKILPTDIVNHRLKIAVEIQSQWHDFEDKKPVDAHKKQFWLDKGYSFYDPDIRDYSVLEMVQLFFDIDKLPDYINYEYSNKLNIKKIQALLDSGLSVPEVESKLYINRHRIYDALHDGRLTYPDKYENACYTPIVQLDTSGNLVKEFESISEANDYYGFKRGAISRALNKGKHFSNGYYWYLKDEYDPKSVQLCSRFSKFHIPVDKYDKQGNYICSYNTIIDASKDSGVSNTQIYKVLTGELKQTGGHVYKRVA